MYYDVTGWDIGGAHLKAARLDASAQSISALQTPCPLWKGLDELDKAVSRLLDQLQVNTPVHVITMTGELVDFFDSRPQGVASILTTMRRLLPDKKIIIYAGNVGFIDFDMVFPHHYSAIASANWLASASFAAAKVGTGLFVDIGSTTTDILGLEHGRVVAKGYTDYERLTTQELIYTGIVRTPVMVIAPYIMDNVRNVGVVAEYFATMADVYRLTGELDELLDQTETADGQEKSAIASARRLARMIGYDFADEPSMGRWQQLAFNFRNKQLDRLLDACECQLQRLKNRQQVCVIGAGIGSFLVKDLACKLGYDYIEFTDIIKNDGLECKGMPLSVCAPAVAMVMLAVCG